MKRDGYNQSLWQETTTEIRVETSPFPANKVFDVVIAGAGITGVATGLALAKAGKSVLILEAHTIGFGTTGGTTAHLNTFLDTPYNTIQKKFSPTDASLVAASVKQALDLIRRNVEEYHIDCGYKQLPGYVFSQNEEQTKELEDMIRASQESNVECSASSVIPVNIPFEKAAEFPGQSTFHAGRYLKGLAEAFTSSGGIILENCRVTGVDDATPNKVTTQSGDVFANHFIYATHIPPGVNLLHFRCAPYRSYAMAFRLESEDAYPPALVYDMHDPYHYYRTQEIDGKLYLIAGGEDHKTGHEQNTDNCFRKLEAHVRNFFPVQEVTHQWSSQYYEPTDGLPYIGHLPGHTGTTYVATGYSGNGMVYSSVAAMLLTDLISTGKSEWDELYDPNRIKMVAGFSNFVKEAADVVGLLLKKTVPATKLSGLSELAKGEAAIVNYEGSKVALYKDDSGEIFALHTACTHIKCDVAWNSTEKTWDCPCHGSRFSYSGEVLTAPARKPLESIDLSDKEE